MSNYVVRVTLLRFDKRAASMQVPCLRTHPSSPDSFNCILSNFRLLLTLRCCISSLPKLHVGGKKTPTKHTHTNRNPQTTKQRCCFAVANYKSGWTIASLDTEVDPTDVVEHGAVHLHSMGAFGAMKYKGPEGSMTIASLDAPVVRRTTC